MKKTLFASIFVLLFGFSINAYSADQGWYMSGNIGISRAAESGLGLFTDAELEDLNVEDVPGSSAALKYDTGFVVGAAVGFDFGNYRIESELVYQMNDFDEITLSFTLPGVGTYSNSQDVDGDATSFALLLNGYYDFLEGRILRPFITAGAGMAKVDSDYADDTVFAYQIGGGLCFEFSEKVIWDLRYRYFSTSDVEVEYVGDVGYSTHSVLLDIRYSF